MSSDKKPRLVTKIILVIFVVFIISLMVFLNHFGFHQDKIACAKVLFCSQGEFYWRSFGFHWLFRDILAFLSGGVFLFAVFRRKKDK